MTYSTLLKQLWQRYECNKRAFQDHRATRLSEPWAVAGKSTNKVNFYEQPGNVWQLPSPDHLSLRSPFIWALCVCRPQPTLLSSEPWSLINCPVCALYIMNFHIRWNYAKMTSVTAPNALVHLLDTLHLQLDFVPFLGVFFEMVLHGKSRWQQIVF